MPLRLCRFACAASLVPLRLPLLISVLSPEVLLAGELVSAHAERVCYAIDVVKPGSD